MRFSFRIAIAASLLLATFLAGHHLELIRHQWKESELWTESTPADSDLILVPVTNVTGSAGASSSSAASSANVTFLSRERLPSATSTSTQAAQDTDFSQDIEDQDLSLEAFSPEKVVVMARLQGEDVDWVREDLPE
ncbi:MAG: hypothetical protein M1819_003973 [Sarea resinae]|nr:MAG: hypothetical protein M1819_003973 [Sarea resinae]